MKCPKNDTELHAHSMNNMTSTSSNLSL